ncbi:MAG TPA: hypothetical protein VHC97_20105 [Thermoanaerobaculia bacterium]|jgi:hypothetical protein|nr:hypothetical protein [Thermoanaerobaculia bacterium]
MNRYFNVLLLSLAVLLLASFPAGAAERPFSLNGGGTVTNGVINGSGRATHLGLYTEAGQLIFAPDPDNPARVLASGTATFTAANGDQLDIVIEDGALDLTTGEGSGAFRVVGGTGRFEGASGGGNFALSQNLVTGAFEITAVGNLDY